MLRFMILLSLVVMLIVIIATQVVLPMYTDHLDFFWLFKKKTTNNDVISIETNADDNDELSAKAHAAKENYKSVKKEIRSRKKKIEKLDRDTNI